MTLRQKSPLPRCLIVALFTALGIPFAAPTGAAEAVFTPQRVAEIRQVTSAALSPDGSQVAYVLSVPRQAGVDEDGEAWTELWVLATGGTTPRPFLTGKVNVSTVRWTPGGREIAFLAKRGDDKVKSLYLIPVAGGEARRVLSPATDIVDYSLAPDGTQVALVAREPEDDAAKKLRDKGFRAEVFEEDWRFQRVWVAPLASQAAPRQLPVDGHARAVRWSPQSAQLLVVVTPTPGVDDSLMRQRLRIIDAGSGALLARIENPGKLGNLEWSPDGQRIAFVSGADIHDPSAGRLMVADARTGNFGQVLDPNWEGDVSDLAWVDATTIAILADEGVESFVARVPASGQGLRPERLPAKIGGVASSLTVTPTGSQMAWVAHTPSHPAELFFWSGTAAPHRRTVSNPWLANIRLARQEVVRHRARDGLELAGILVRPLDEQTGKRYPLILSVHGGPEAHVGHGWVTSYSTPGQLGAARGFAVFSPNYRGSTGRGVAFSKLGQADAAGREFDDLVDAVDHLIATGLVDAKKVGVTGGSYGGYATAWCSTRFSDRFAAGVMFVGISNKISKVGTTDIPDEEFYVHGRKRPWDAWQFLLERSPIFHTANARTPLLILHGKDDPRVNPGQSRELYRHLKMRGQAPVRLVFYPGEEHGNRRAAARLDYNLRQLQWLEHYLIGPGGAPPPYQLDYGLPKADRN